MADHDSKACRRCGTTKPISDFAANASKHDGLQTWCRQCKVEVQRESRKLPAAPKQIPDFKKCSTCRGLKPNASFGRCTSGTDGLQVQCRECKAAAHKKNYVPNPRVLKVRVPKPVKVKPVYPDGHKRCPKCAEVKPFEGFNKNKNCADGFSVWCKPCHRDKNKGLRAGKLFTGLLEASYTCQKCGTGKPSSEFYKHKRDGVQPWCKACFKENKAVPDSERQKWSRVPGSQATYKCGLCQDQLPEVAFSIGKKGVRTLCMVCSKIDSAKRKDAELAVLRARTEKPCRSCKQVLPVSQFDYHHHTADRYRSNCKACASRLLIERAVLATKSKTRLSAIRYERLRLATPKWSDTKKVRAIYREARRLERKDGIKRHVDHVIPLAGRKVCGLHVSDNLRIVGARENTLKHNHFEIQ